MLKKRREFHTDV